MGLNLVTVLATPHLPLKRSNAQGTFPSTLRANVMLCELWPHPVETTHVLYPQNGCSHNIFQQQSPDVHRSNP